MHIMSLIIAKVNMFTCILQFPVPSSTLTNGSLLQISKTNQGIKAWLINHTIYKSGLY